MKSHLYADALCLDFASTKGAIGSKALELFSGVGTSSERFQRLSSAALYSPSVACLLFAFHSPRFNSLKMTFL